LCGCRGVLMKRKTHPSTPLERGIARVSCFFYPSSFIIGYSVFDI
jgi:hypothetical protein